MKANTTAIGALRDAIEELQGEIIGNENAVARLQQQIDAYNEQIKSMRKQIKDYENGIVTLGGTVL